MPAFKSVHVMPAPQPGLRLKNLDLTNSEIVKTFYSFDIRAVSLSETLLSPELNTKKIEPTASIL